MHRLQFHASFHLTGWLLAAQLSLTTPSIQADSFRLIFCGDTQIQWACCNCTDDDDPAAAESCYEECGNGLCNFLTYDQVDAQAEWMNTYYVQALNVLAAQHADLRGVVINGDLTAYGHSDELDSFKEHYEDDLNLPLWLGLGNHDYSNNIERNDDGQGCFDNECPNDMLRYLQSQALATAAIAMARGQVTYWSFDIDEGDTYYEFPVNRRDITGSFAYSFDMGDYNFIQLNNYPGYEVYFETWNAGDAREDRFNVTSSYDWLREELRKARARGKRSILNYHDHIELHDELGTDIKTMNDPEFLDAIHDMNVEAIFVGHIHSSKGYVSNQKVASYYGPRGTYSIPVYYSGNPIFGYLLLVNFPSGAPIEVQMVDLTGHQHPAPITTITASQLIAQEGELSVAPPYSCAIPEALDAALDTRMFPYLVDDSRTVKSTFFAGEHISTLEEADGVFALTSPCDAKTVLDGNFSALPADWQGSLDATCWDGNLFPTSGGYFFRGSQAVRLQYFPLQITAPDAILTLFPNLPAAFQSDLDAVVRTPSRDTLYIFKGSQFLIYNTTTQQVTQAPQAIGSTFKVPGYFQGDLDDVLYVRSQETYLLRGNRYARVDLLTGAYLGTGSIADKFGVTFPDASTPFVAGESCATPINLRTFETVRFDNRAMQSNWPFSGACLSGFEHDVWYSWYAGEDGPSTIRVQPDGGCAQGLSLGVYYLYPLQAIGCGEGTSGEEDEDPASAVIQCTTAPCGRATSLTFQAQRGNLFAIRLGGAAGATGTITIDQGLPPSAVANDRCAEYRVIIEAGNFLFPIAGATLDLVPGDGSSGPDCAAMERDIWFLWSSAQSGRIRADMCTATVGAVGQIVVYESLPCLVEQPVLACARGECGANAAIFHAVAGHRYAIRVGLDSSATDGVLRIRAEADDAFEPNQGCDQAVTLGTGVYQGMALDEDWFRVLVPSSGELRAKVDYAPTDGTIELFLHSSCDLAAIATPLKFSKGEELVWVNTSVNNTLIYLRLRPRDPAVPRIPYALTINATRNAFDDSFEPNDDCAQPAPIPTGRHTDLRSTAVDPDWYVATVPRMGRMDFTLVPKSVDHHLELFVYSPDIPGASGSCPGPIMWLGRPDAQGNLVASLPERFGVRSYSLHVSSFVFTNDYDLDIRVDDRFAGNDSCGGGPLLETGGHSELAIDRNREDWYRIFVPTGGILTVDVETSTGQGPYPAMTLWRACGALEALAQDVDTPQGKRLFHVNSGPDREMRLSVGLTSTSEATVIYRLQVSVEGDCDRDQLPDRTELAHGDCNQNGVPDDCDSDLDQDGLPDDCIFTGPSFRRSDCNDDGAQDISDSIHMLGVLFLGSPLPPCLEACNANDDARFDLSDAVYLLSHLFLGKAAPPQPYPACGVDPLPESSLGCGASACGS